MTKRGLARGALMLAIGALLTWGLAGALEEHALVHNRAAYAEQAPAVAVAKPSASRWMF